MKTSEINDELGIAAQLDEVVDRKTADDLAAIAELARIPRYRRDEFCLAVVNLILVLWEDWVLYRYQSPHSNQIRRLQEAELAVRAARDASARWVRLCAVSSRARSGRWTQTWTSTTLLA